MKPIDLTDPQQRLAYAHGARSAAGLATQYEKGCPHEYRLEDCILHKLNLMDEKPRRRKDLIVPPKLMPAFRMFQAAGRASNAWSDLVEAGIKIHGEKLGPHISGVYNDKWPDVIQEALRTLAQEVNLCSDAAWALRPSRTRHATMMKLKHQAYESIGDKHGIYG